MGKYDTFGLRLRAGLLDWLIFFLISYLGDTLFTKNALVNIIWVTLYYLLALFYPIFFHGRYGQTFGKMSANIRLVAIEDETKIIGFKRAFYRESIWAILILIDLFFIYLNLVKEEPTDSAQYTSSISFFWVLLEFVTMMFNKKRRAIHDFFGKSVVINLNAKTHLHC